MSAPIGESIYLDRDQCEYFETSYMNDGVKFVCSAEAWLKSKAQGYDEFHTNILKPLGPKTIVAMGTGYGWFQITEVR
jgi:hypothetical protein